MRIATTPWILRELHDLGLIDAGWTLSWVALRDRNYLFEFTQGKERLIVKCLRRENPESAVTAEFLSNEIRVLRLLEEWNGLARIPKLAPRPVAEFPARGIWVQEWVPGLPLHPDELLKHEALQFRVLDRLRSLAEIGSGGPLTVPELMAEFRPSRRGHSQIRDTSAQRAAHALSGRLRPCLGHNDLNPSNILVGPGELAFADWTFSGERCLPCFDWFDLVSHSQLESHSLSWSQLADRVASRSYGVLANYLGGAMRLTGCSELSRNLLLLYFSTRFSNLVDRYQPELSHSAIASVLRKLDWLEVTAIY